MADDNTESDETARSENDGETNGESRFGSIANRIADRRSEEKKETGEQAPVDEAPGEKPDGRVQSSEEHAGREQSDERDGKSQPARSGGDVTADRSGQEPGQGESGRQDQTNTATDSGDRLWHRLNERRAKGANQPAPESDRGTDEDRPEADSTDSSVGPPTDSDQSPDPDRPSDSDGPPELDRPSDSTPSESGEDLFVEPTTSAETEADAADLTTEELLDESLDIDSESDTQQPSPGQQSDAIRELITDSVQAFTLVYTDEEGAWSFFEDETLLQERNLLLVSIGDPSPSLRRVWDRSADRHAGERGLVRVGNVASAGTQQYDDRHTDVVKQISTTSDISRIGIVVSQTAKKMSENGKGTIIIIDSFTDLSRNASVQTLFRFGYLLESYFRTLGLHGFCGLSKGKHTETQLNTLMELFDSVIERSGDDGTVRVRTLD